MNKQPLILVVEKNINHLELLNSHLKSLNFACICATQGIKGLILAQTHRPNLIILDMMISDIRSVQVIDFLKRETQTANIPIIATFPWYLARESERQFLKGTDNYITKPYDFNQLEIVLSQYFNQLSFSGLLSG
ncbi:PleD family two-component system response regulator [Nostoc sp. FACHB-110]|uniref:response regulator n=1 Tax=Nostoc sp. FACHB-110 TaxID=2692834 RepID=UPI001683EB98|nr:response regulator [Nostoc sp. FACHB-110]MBD2435695.1 response regulator [Nostoc sp. FACHB-110]